MARRPKALPPPTLERTDEMTVLHYRPGLQPRCAACGAPISDVRPNDPNSSDAWTDDAGAYNAAEAHGFTLCTRIPPPSVH